MLSLFPQLFAYQLFTVFILRIVLAVIFIGHGYSKLFKTLDSTAAFFDSINLKPGKFWTRCVGAAELLSGILLFVGFLTQAATAIIAILMAVAIVKVDIKKGFFGGWEFPLLILAAALVLLFTGPGIYAFDLPL